MRYVSLNLTSAPLNCFYLLPACCLIERPQSAALGSLQIKTDLYVDFTFRSQSDFLSVSQMKGSSVSCCCNGVLKQLTRLSLCEGKGGWGRRSAGWTGKTCTESEGAPGVKLNMFTNRKLQETLQNKIRRHL